jgi:glycosyltransferase 2 family protein
MLGIVVKVAATILLIWLVFRGRDVPALLEQMVRTDWRAPAAALLILVMFSPLFTWRWSAILSALGYPRRFRTLFPIVWIGIFFTQTIPSGLGGDVARIWLLHKTKLPGTIAVSSMLIDRLIGILAILLFVVASATQLISWQIEPSLVYGVIALAVLVACGFVVLLMLDLVPAMLRRYRSVDMLVRFSAHLRSILFSPVLLWRPLVCSVVIQLALAIAVYVLAKGLGLSITLAACLVIIPISNLVQAVPISVGGWGLREGFFLLAFGQVGVSEIDALTLSVLFGLCNLFASLPGALVWLAYGRRAAAEASIEAPTQNPRQGVP